MASGDKFFLEGYCDLNRFIHSGETRSELRTLMLKANSQFKDLYKVKYPKEETINSDWENYFNNHLLDYDESKMTISEAESLMKWFYHSLSSPAKRQEKTISELIPHLETQYGCKEGIGYIDGIIFDKSKVSINFIKSLDEFSCELPYITKLGSSIFYRGHADVNFLLAPTIMRNDNWKKNEFKMYSELQRVCPDDFKKDSSHLEILTHMQHYDLPTRLLDITEDPLVGLYFACCSLEVERAELIVFAVPSQEIKYAKSDTAAILASLPMFTFDKQQEILKLAKNEKLSKTDFNDKPAVRRLLQEVKSEKPEFKDEIDREDLLKSIVVLPLKSNKRIAKQNGAFILCGLSRDYMELKINELRYCDDTCKKQIYVITDKPAIRKQLEQFFITSASLFPEIDDVAHYIKDKYR